MRPKIDVYNGQWISRSKPWWPHSKLQPHIGRLFSLFKVKSHENFMKHDDNPIHYAIWEFRLTKYTNGREIVLPSFVQVNRIYWFYCKRWVYPKALLNFLTKRVCFHPNLPSIPQIFICYNWIIHWHPLLHTLISLSINNVIWAYNKRMSFTFQTLIFCIHNRGNLL